MTGTADNNKDVATLGGGCFWCIEAVYQHVQGVTTVESGYMGGKHPNPSYEAVCTGVTGHAEVVQVTFDPAVVTYRDVLHIFFAVHDPTTLNRQGNDAGTQYRSAIFYHSPEQATTAKDVIATLTTDNVFASRPNRHRNRTRPTVLSGGGLSPGIFHAQSRPTLLRLPHRPQTRKIPPAIRLKTENHLIIFAFLPLPGG